MKPGMLIDITKCIGCEACSRACKEANHLPPEVDKDLTWKTWKIVTQEQGFFYAKACMHCGNPTCVSVCPVGAMKKNRAGSSGLSSRDLHRLKYSEKRCHEFPCGTVWIALHEDRPQYLVGFRDTLIGRRPYTKIDQDMENY